jgi:hypothetical protein
MKLTRLFFLLMILGSLAIAAHAQTPLPPPSSGGAGDPRIVFPDACPTNASCATLTTGDMPVDVPDCTSSDTLSQCLAIGLVIDVASPISVGPSFNSLWFCTQDAPPTFSEVAALGTITTFGIGGPFAPQFPGLTGTFTGCEYWSGDIAANTSVGIAEVGGVAPLVIPEGFVGAGDLVFTPEPGTSLLFMSGLLLISLGGIARKRFRTASRT